MKAMRVVVQKSTSESPEFIAHQKRTICIIGLLEVPTPIYQFLQLKDVEARSCREPLFNNSVINNKRLSFSRSIYSL